MLASQYVTSIADYEFGGAAEAVAAFAADFPELAKSAADGLTALLEDFPDEAARDTQLDVLGWGFVPGPGKLDAFLSWTRTALKAMGAPSTATG